ncbi:flagellar motor switch protein FliG [Cypionkella aquatica]|uniref:Flagellar motor switch protein FliG n=1 Tax=Cypionkella aquatica TaxID=1756042 RepID=A0AA37TTM7_9RHOB|nr:FliG C-terminal domain-containing protein [Cypionkella aquatica]GLS87358.1 flagellar motor switch protein FliG [Cypionkella aquatica]
MAGEPAVLARITPVQRRAQAPQPSPRQKAAIIVQFLLAEGGSLPLAKLPDQMQAALAEQMSQMRTVDRRTLAAVIEEFLGELDQVGLSFPGGIEAALSMMDGHISANAASRLRRMAASSASSDPWERLTAMPVASLLPVLEQESIEVGAVMLSKLPVAKSAELLGKLPGEKARRVAYAVSQTGNVDPDTVRRIGISLANQLESQPLRAFQSNPVDRVGAILNISPALTREDVLKGLDEADAGFAQQVRRAIFTFVHLPKRLLGRDVPKLIRIVDQAQLITVLAASAGVAEREASAEFLLSNMSQRMAQGLREEAVSRGRVKEKDAEDAMNQIISAVRQLEAAGELVLIQEDDQ